jgi:tRNA threonylcarbamoyladenosine biosynthesis protein TsaE
MTNEGVVHYSRSAEETVQLGKKIGSCLLPNDVIALTGQLGAGKTTIIQGIAEGLGVKDYVTSPTFIIINEYQGRLPFYHVDLYRLDEVKEIEDLGIEEYFNRGGVCVIEWAEKLKGLLPAMAGRIEIEVVSETPRFKASLVNQPVLEKYLDQFGFWQKTIMSARPILSAPAQGKARQFNAGMARHGKAGRGKAWQFTAGRARPGEAWQGMAHGGLP